MSPDSSLSMVSPIDGRYRKDVGELYRYCSEFALLRYRVLVEVRYLEAFASQLGSRLEVSEEDVRFLRKISSGFGEEEAREVKAYEERVGHDVVAVVEYLKYRCRRGGHGKLARYVHFGLTSDDVNNLSYSLMLKDALLKLYIPALLELCRVLSEQAKEARTAPMLGHTHGQPASPTTLGKELANYLIRLSRIAGTLSVAEFPGKATGAVGNFSALHFSYPEVDWVKFSSAFVSSLGLRPEIYTTQVLPHDGVTSVLQTLALADRVLQNMDVDLWLYCSLGYLKVKSSQGQVGSSTMPHKVNPIDFENSEGNAKVGGSLLDLLSSELEMSRMQRDLSDSTLKRNYGVAFAHSLLAVKKASAGLRKIETDLEQMNRDLDGHAEVLGEALQHSLRKLGREGAFDDVMELLKGRTLSVKEFRETVRASPVGEDTDPVLLTLTPQQYVGLAPELVDLALKEASATIEAARARCNKHVSCW
ncbi:MAG: adenylosuccinate lyase [Conexivisphaerales archaeon]